MTNPESTPYDEIAYPTFPISYMYPDRPAVIATHFGIMKRGWLFSHIPASVPLRFAAYDCFQLWEVVRFGHRADSIKEGKFAAWRLRP
jgi:hypothetical protein